MKNLVYKEFRLAAHPTNYIFLSFAFMPVSYTHLTLPTT